MGFRVEPVGRGQDQVTPTNPHLHIRTAALADVDEVLDLLAEASTWTRSRGIENWPARFSRRLITGNAERGELHVAEADGAIVATFARLWSDEFFWGPNDVAAGYVHRLAVRRAAAGAGLGYRLLAWIDADALAAGCRALRLDVVSTNHRLREYYETAGLGHVRDLTGELTEPDGTVRQW